jgi:DNA-binding response OmpR family regulator
MAHGVSISESDPARDFVSHIPGDLVAQDGRPTALLVESDVLQLAEATRVLGELGYAVIPAAGFDEARRELLAVKELSLLVADVRLGAFNGLHLAFRARAHHPNVRVVIIDQSFDVTLEAETKRLGGVYLARPFAPGVFATNIPRHDQGLIDAPRSTSRRWPRRPVAGILAAVGPREARLSDVSYGGLCLEFPGADVDASLPSTLDVELKEVGLSLRMHPVWVRTTSSSPVWQCGGEVIPTSSPAMEQWREFVDSRTTA